MSDRFANPNAARWNTYNLDQLLQSIFAQRDPWNNSLKTTEPGTLDQMGIFPPVMGIFPPIWCFCCSFCTFVSWNRFWEVAWQLNLLPVSQAKEGESNVRGGWMEVRMLFTAKNLGWTITWKRSRRHGNISLLKVLRFSQHFRILTSCSRTLPLSFFRRRREGVTKKVSLWSNDAMKEGVEHCVCGLQSHPYPECQIFRKPIDEGFNQGAGKFLRPLLQLPTLKWRPSKWHTIHVCMQAIFKTILTGIRQMALGNAG